MLYNSTLNHRCSVLYMDENCDRISMRLIELYHVWSLISCSLPGTQPGKAERELKKFPAILLLSYCSLSTEELTKVEI